MWGITSLAEDLIVSHEALCSVEWGGNTPAPFTVTPLAGKVLPSVFGLFQCADGEVPGTWTRSERRPMLRHAERLARGHQDKTSGLLTDSVILNVKTAARPTDRRFRTRCRSSILKRRTIPLTVRIWHSAIFNVLSVLK
jgi:hypothetical protein